MDKFDELVEELDLDEIEDFEAKGATYEVWLLGYTAEQTITDYEKLVKSFTDAETAVKFAKEYVEAGKVQENIFPAEVKYVEVLVETIIDFDDYNENIGNLFDEIIKI